MKRGWVWVLIFSLAVLPAAAQATERGLAAYPDGVENFFAGAFPPPGFYYQNYLLYYNAPLIRGNVPPEATVYSVAEVLRFIYSSKVKLLGANWGVQVVVPLLYVGFRSKPAGISDYQFGVGNIAFNPFILAWHFKEFHITTGFDFIFPGTYDRNNIASPSQNYFTFQPVLGLAWLPKWGLGVNVKLMYDIPTRNNDPLPPFQNYYDSGQAFHFDYCIDYAVRPDLRIGAAGFYYVQTTADKADGRTLGNHGRQFAIGPGIKYDYKKWSFLFITNFEMATINRPEGTRFWWRVWYAF